MNIFDAFKKRSDGQEEKEFVKTKAKKQLNVNVNPLIIDKLHHLSAEFAVPCYAVAGHAIQIGSFYLSKVLENPNKRDAVRIHLVHQHLLEDGFDDAEELIRIAEGHYKSEMITLLDNFVNAAEVLQRAIAYGKKTGRVEPMNAAETQFLLVAFDFADWISKHPLDES